jgi:hypothetical protein
MRCVNFDAERTNAPLALTSARAESLADIVGKTFLICMRSRAIEASAGMRFETGCDVHVHG